MIKCNVCGKICKNLRGLAIHQGHTHKKVPELKELQREIVFLKDMMISLTQEIRTLKGSPMRPPSAIPKNRGDNGNNIPIGMNYGPDHGALMDELRATLKSRGTS